MGAPESRLAVPDISDTLMALAASLSAGGVRTVVDSRDVNPPCALLVPPVFRWTFGGRLAVDYRLIVIVPSSGMATEMKALAPMMDTVSAILGGAPITATPAAFNDPAGGDPLPAYELTWTAKSGKG